MDLSSMLNDGPLPEKTASRRNSPEIQRHSNTHPYPPGGSYAPPTHHQTPLYATPSQDIRSASRSVQPQQRGLTPLRTPNAAQNQPLNYSQQSPGAPPGGHQYRAFDTYSAQSQHPSHGHPNGGHQPSPGVLYHSNGGPPNLHRQPTSSHSSTPQSHHSQLPHSVRQSPVNIPTPQNHPQQHSYPHPHQSTPSTPLGPPPLHYQRTSNHSQADAQSPYLQRNFSGASNGIAAGSPAQHHPSIGNLLESPSSYNRPSPQHQLQRTSDYLAQQDRERSLSVSPKTKVPPRPPSLVSRHSSQDMYSVRNSIQQSGAPATATSATFIHHPAMASAPQYANTVSGVAQAPPPLVPQLSAQTSMASSLAGKAESVERGVPLPLSQASSLSPTLQQQHHSQKMGMNQLLASTNPVAHNPNSAMAAASNVEPEQSNGRYIKSEGAVVAAPPPTADVRPTEGSRAPQQSNEMLSNGNMSRDAPPADAKAGVKRPAEAAPAVEPPAKKTKRQHKERPIWAQFASTNQRRRGGASHQNGGPPPPQRNQHEQSTRQQSNRQQVNTPNGHKPSRQSCSQPSHDPRTNADRPWLDQDPFDRDLITARELLGEWERTYEWSEPNTAMSTFVQNWLFQELSKYPDVGNDPAEGTLEIEAKIGTLFSKSTDERANMDAATALVINPAMNHKYYFESKMSVHEHKHMNGHLNASAAKSQQPGRSPIRYVHTFETDSFLPLSQAGLAALPPALKSNTQSSNRDLKLRTTTNTKTGEVTARIIKLKLADLHILNPGEGYDCRISINLECNLNSPIPGFDHDALTIEPSPTRPAQPARVKDRVSYKHLAYQIDLTRVDVRGMPTSSFELEIEVAAEVLREQMGRAVRGEKNAYRDVVEGFLNNAAFLMRQRAAVQQPQGQGQ